MAALNSLLRLMVRQYGLSFVLKGIAELLRELADGDEDPVFHASRQVDFASSTSKVVDEVVRVRLSEPRA